MAASFDITEETRKTLEEKCRKCVEVFRISTKGEPRIFPYQRCKNCSAGQQLHKAEMGWGTDYTKTDV